MSNSWFQFKQFRIEQKNAAMKVGTDSLILGSWVQPQCAQTVLDIGCGTGILSLMMVQRFDSRVTAVEIDKLACADARQNFKNSKWKDQIDIYCESFQDFLLRNNEQFDFIISNPPFFNNSLKPASESRKIARHTDTLPLPVLLTGAFRLLQPKGTLALILPASLVSGLLLRAALIGLHCKRQLLVKPKRSKDVHRCVLELVKTKTECRNENLVVYDQQGYSTEYKELTRDFYLNF